MLHHLDILRPKTKTPGNSTWYFSWSPLEIPSWFKLTPEKSTCYFFNTPGNSISSNLRKIFSFSGSSYAETLIWQEPLIPAPFYWKLLEHLIVLNLNHITYLSTISSCLLLAKKQDGLRCSSMKTLLLLLTKSPNARKFCFSVYFLPFFLSFFLSSVFVFWPIKITTANLPSNPSKSTNQVTLGNKHLNHLFWV